MAKPQRLKLGMRLWRDNNYMEKENIKMNVEEIVKILSEAVQDLTEKKITPRRALAISRTSMALIKAIEITDLNKRVELLEQILKKRK